MGNANEMSFLKKSFMVVAGISGAVIGCCAGLEIARDANLISDLVIASPLITTFFGAAMGCGVVEAILPEEHNTPS